MVNFKRKKIRYHIETIPIREVIFPSVIEKNMINFNILKVIKTLSNRFYFKSDTDAWHRLIKILEEENITTLGQLEMRLKRQ